MRRCAFCGKEFSGSIGMWCGVGCLQKSKGTKRCIVYGSYSPLRCTEMKVETDRVVYCDAHAFWVFIQSPQGSESFVKTLCQKHADEILPAFGLEKGEDGRWV